MTMINFVVYLLGQRQTLEDVIVCNGENQIQGHVKCFTLFENFQLKI
jgi:hypothetical protein